MLIGLLKLPFKAMALILIPGLMILHFIGSLLIGLSSILTHILTGVFLFGSAAGFITHQPADILTRTICIGLFFSGVPLYRRMAAREVDRPDDRFAEFHFCLIW